MTASSSMPATKQALINDHFDSTSAWWRDIYEDPTLKGKIFRARSAIALEWIDELGLEPGAKALEIGCGAGLTTVALAERGFTVEGTDSSESMVRVTRANAAAASVADRVVASVRDAHRLDYPDDSFDLVVAIGVLSYFHSPAGALGELARVTRPGGHLVITTLNPMSLVDLVEPYRSPLLRPVREWLRRPLQALGLHRSKSPVVSPTRYLASRTDRLVHAAGFVRVRARGFGFGPFTFMNRPLLPDAAGERLHSRLQRVADRGVPVIRNAGRFCVVLSRKPGEPSGAGPAG